MKFFLAALTSIALTTASSAADQFESWSSLRGGYDWSGSYLGGHLGYGWGGSGNSWHGGGFPPWQPDGDINYQSLGGGLHLGHQQQFDTIVAGVEADLGLGRYFGDDSQFAGVVNQIEINAVSSLRGRLGWAQDNVLFYGTAGLAAANFLKNEVGGLPTTPQLAIGWTAGGGVELATGDNWRIRAEYLHTRFGDVDTFLNYMHRANSPTLNVIRIGASYSL